MTNIADRRTQQDQVPQSITQKSINQEKGNL